MKTSMIKAMVTTTLLIGILGTHAVRADDSLSDLATLTSPCAAAALNAGAQSAEAAIKASQKTSNPMYYSFNSFGPLQLTTKEADAGANEVYWVGFTGNVEGKPLNYRVAIYCQQGGWKTVVSVTQQ